MKDRTQSVVCLAAFGLVLVLVAACTESGMTSATDDGLRLARELAIAQPGPVMSDARQVSRVYIDASLSMAGFVRKSSPSSRSSFDDVLDALGDVVRGEIVKYGKPFSSHSSRPARELEVQPTNYGAAIHSEVFYDQEFNPDDLLIEQIVAEDPPRLSIVVTDGVHSNPAAENNPPLVRAFARWFEKGGTLGIFVFRSRYQGRFYSERLRRMIHTSPVTRPFYAFVLSPTATELQRLQDQMKVRLGEAVSAYVFSDTAITASLLDDASHAHVVWRTAGPPDTPFLFRAITSDVFRIAKVSQTAKLAQYDFTMRFNIAKDYPVQELRAYPKHQYHPWEGSAFARTSSPPPEGTVVSYINCPTPDCVTISVAFNRLASPYTVYGIKVEAHPVALQDKVRELSTRDDSVPENADKTFLFYELLHGLTDVHSKARLSSALSPTLFLMIANR